MVTERQVITCYRHPKRETGRYCTRCGQPACPDCLTPAPVGAHCLGCVKAAERKARDIQRRNGVKRDLPVVGTALLIAGLVVGFAYAQQSPIEAGSGYGDAREVLVRWGLIDTAVAGGEWYRMITSAFVHVEALHLLLAVASVALLGSQLEREEGPARLLALFGAAAIAGALGDVVVLESKTLSWGAAAGCSGIAAAALVRAARWNVLAARVPAVFLGLTALFSVMSVGPGALGSLAAGAAVGLLFGAATTFKARAVDAWRTLPLLAVIAGGCVYVATTLQPGL